MTMALDAIALEILGTRLVSIVDEAAAIFVRTAFSSLAREANDFAVVLTDGDGHSVAQSSVSIPSFIGTLPASVKHFIAHFSKDGLQENDVLITNDPWKGTGHIHDITVAVPIYRSEKLIAFAAITSHMPDIGGRIRSSGIREIYEEGLQIPITKLVTAGVTNDVVVDFIKINVRIPQATMGDIWGEVAACHQVAKRLNELLDEIDVDFGDASNEICARSESAMRAAIRDIPDGSYRYEILHDGFEERIVIRNEVIVAGDRIRIDYTGTSQQLPRAVNVAPIYTFAYTSYGVKATLCPDIPNNEGSFVPIETSAPEGSLLNPRYPAAGGARGMIGHLLPVAFMGAMADILPNVVWAPGSANSSVTLSGTSNGRPYGGVFFINAGQGASKHRDGLSAISFPSNLSNTPVEIMEQSVPIKVRHRRIRKGSGGSGKTKGGDGIDFCFEFVGDSPAICSFILTRMKVAPPGIHGGEAGKVGRIQLNGQQIDAAEHVILKSGDLVQIETAGGGGFGRSS